MTSRLLIDALARRAARVITEPPFVPTVKALLSVDGGTCPRDGSALQFDPWSPHTHQCPACGQVADGERHHRAWARWQHLWLGERIACLATLAAVDNHQDAGRRAAALLGEYASRYLDYPNADNVLGPARLFFSTYLESIWLTNVMAGALALREAGVLDEATIAATDGMANEAVALVIEFNEGHSNRQTWHNAALIALALWFEDEELLRATLDGPTGMVAHLTQGFGSDGMWFEGENYHLFALRGLLIGLDMARSAGLDAFQDPALALRIGAALRAPLQTALPDLTFPARKDSRFGVSLAQPMYLELWEAGASLLPDAGDLAAWLDQLYALPAPPARDFDSWLHDAGVAPPPQRSRASLSWWMALLPDPAPPAPLPHAAPASRLLAGQGLAILRTGGRYVSLECGIVGGGHGHPDRLHLTLHQDGIHWLPDPGTGSYVSPDLPWYRSTLAHNAPRLDGMSQPAGDASCTAFAVRDEWGWVQGRFGDVMRTVVSGPGHVLDVVELSAGTVRQLELPWHLAGEWEVVSPGRWEPISLDEPFVTTAEQWEKAGDGAVQVRCRAGQASLVLAITGADALIRAMAPGLPGGLPRPFLLARATGSTARLVTVLSRGQELPTLSAQGELVVVEHDGMAIRQHQVHDGWMIEAASGTLTLGGRRAVAEPPAPSAHRVSGAHAVAPFLDDAIASLVQEDASLFLDQPEQYRRSEEPWDEEASFTARGWVGWNDTGLVLAVEVSRPECSFRAADAPPLRLDNEPDAIHSDGLELFVQPVALGPTFGFVLVPQESGAVWVRGAAGTRGTPDMVTASWTRIDGGYRVEARLVLPGWSELAPGAELGFDVLVNEMRPGRERRAGQLVWSGDGGWVWLRGDRHDPALFGTLELGT